MPFNIVVQEFERTPDRPEVTREVLSMEVERVDLKALMAVLLEPPAPARKRRKDAGVGRARA